jgi:hypothetical protein
LIISFTRILDRPLAFWKLVLRIFADIFTFTLLLMMALADVSIAPEVSLNILTEPLGDAAAKAPFELYIFFAVFGAILHRDITVMRTGKLL